MIEKDMRLWLMTLETGLRAFYQHMDKAPGTKFVWFKRAGDDTLDTIDASGEPDIIYFDVEIYASELDDQVALNAALRAKRDHRGAFGEAWVEDVQVQDQQDDYEPQASGDSLPPFMASFRLTVTGYE